MFGRNKIAKLDHGDGEHLQVVKGSPFYTIQGEGPYAGMPAVFIRLHGCHLRCTFCDTNFDDPDDPVMSLDDLKEQIRRVNFQAKVAVITGGEPMRQNIMPLVMFLYEHFSRVQIETAGTFWIDDIHIYADIVCSPKTPTIHPMIHAHAKAFKYVISGSQQFGGGEFGYIPIVATQPNARPAQLALPRRDALIYLSPCDERDELLNRFNRRLVGRLAMEFGVIAGLQMHKYMELD